ncbi:aquaporin-10-like [Liolophura sinensis]|uniref:aquaporin-10-like n=1 Tax=Liolophura sinensis TaxID=3198878 RepID=UPI0031593BFA
MTAPDSKYVRFRAYLLSKIRVRSPLGREILSEFIGTFFLVTFAVASGAQYVLSRQELSSFLTVNLAGGVGLTFAVYWSCGPSGAVLNPSVTLAFCIEGRIPWWKYPFYAITQVCAAFVAAAIQFGVYHDAINHYDGGVRQTYGPQATAGIFSTFPQDYVSTTNCFFDQVFGTFILAGCILAMTDKRHMFPSKGLLPIALGLIVFAIGTSFALNCGYAINPARDFGPRLFTVVAGWGIEPISYRNYNWFWVPIVGPLVGATVACFVYNIFIQAHWPPEDEDENDPVDDVEQGKSMNRLSTISTVDNGAALEGLDNKGFSEERFRGHRRDPVKTSRL